MHFHTANLARDYCLAPSPLLCAYYHHHLLVGLMAGGQAERSQDNAQSPHLGTPAGTLDGVEAAQLLHL
jgi:hypothetical protein